MKIPARHVSEILFFIVTAMTSTPATGLRHSMKGKVIWVCVGMCVFQYFIF